MKHDTIGVFVGGKRLFYQSVGGFLVGFKTKLVIKPPTIPAIWTIEGSVGGQNRYRVKRRYFVYGGLWY